MGMTDRSINKMIKSLQLFQSFLRLECKEQFAVHNKTKTKRSKRKRPWGRSGV